MAAKAIRNFLLSVCIVLAVVIVGCRQKPQAGSDTDSTEPNTTSMVPMGDEGIAVRVNDVNIMEDDVEAIVEPIIKTYEEKPEQYSDDFIAQRKKELRQEALKKLIFEQLLTEEVEKQGIVVSDQEVDDKIAQLADAQEPNMTVEEYLKTVQATGKTLAAFRDEVKKQIGWDKVAANYIAGKTDVTEEEAKTYYTEHEDVFKTPELVRASHILIRPLDMSDPNAKAEAKSRAEDLLKQLREGADFAELAMDYSDDESSIHGGDLGYFQEAGKYERPFAKAAFALDVNQISDIVETSFGYHIIKVTDRKPEEKLTFEQIKDSLIDKLKKNKQLKLIREFFQELQQKADIKIHQ